MKTNINQTLKKKLVISPNPKCNEREFWQLYDRMFGNRSDIIEFLDSTETQKKFELSKRIINRVAFESNFPPVTELLDYIHDFEGTIRYKRSIKHVGRDHYIHLCYLYLFGIYVFFYYSKMNLQLHSALSLVRFSSGISEENCFVKNFISVWKYFVLYHDIAYQFEYLGDEKHEYSELEGKEKEKTAKLFDPAEIKAAISKGMKLRTLSTLVALNNTIEDNSNKPANTLAYLKRNKDQFDKLYGIEIDDFLRDSENKTITFMKYVWGGDDIKYYLSLYKYNDFFVVLKENSNIKCIVGENFLFADKAVSDSAFIKKIINDKVLVFSDEWNIQFPNYTVEYYGINLCHKIDDFFSRISIPKNLMTEFKFGLKTSSRMKDVVFECYLACLNHLKEEDDSQKDFEELEQICKKELFKVLENNYIPERNVEEQNGEYEYAHAFLDHYLKYIKRALTLTEQQSDHILNAAVKKFSKENNEKRNMKYIYKKISDAIDQHKIVEEIEAGCETEGNIFGLYKIEKYNMFLELLSNDDQKYLTASLQKAVKCDRKALQEILKDYHTNYSVYDHGVTASSIFILHFYYYQKIIENVKNNIAKDNILIRMCFNIPNISNTEELKELIRNKYMLDYSETIRQVAYAILVHNLYPDNFTSTELKRMKVSSETNPFAYFCMICDALQDWGRPFNINPIEEDFTLYLDSLKVNIKFDNYINVRFKEDNPAIIEKRLKPFAHELDSYLEEAGSMMRVKFI